jgi:membrane-bound lytic murein transglycosylase B
MPVRKYIMLTLLVMLFSFSAARVHADAGFESWIKTFRSEALSQGVSGATYDSAFRGVTEPDARVLEKAAYQPEFRTETWEYIDNRVHVRAITRGQAMLEEHGDVLMRIEQQTGVSRYVLLAIWSMESNYGAVLQDKSKLHDIPQALATLAYADPKRARFARTQLVAALKILQAGDVKREDLLGSWAGAMGHTQFIPTSYLLYAVDQDGDGKRDIWHSIPDALGTAAQLLKKNGWRTGDDWGYEVSPMQNSQSDTQTLAQWQQAGVTRINHTAFPDAQRKAELKVLQGMEGPAFLVLKNFFVVKAYNNADKYALGILLLADRIAGRPAPVQDWQRPYTVLDVSEKEELQRLLLQKGFYSGKVDGLVGDETRKAIQRFQAGIVQAQTGYPSKEVLRQLRAEP